MSVHASIANSWIGRDAFYEARAAYRPRENSRFYQQLVRHYYSFLVPPGANVLEMGCRLGDLVAEVKPAKGVGIDFSAKTIALARERHPEFEFHVGNADDWTDPRSARFDYILLSDLINDLPDVQAVFEHLKGFAKPQTRLVLNFPNTLWRPAIAVAEWIGFKAKSPVQNWLSSADVKNLLHLAGWEFIRQEHRILWPLRVPVLEGFLNRWIAPLLPDLCSTIFIVARPKELTNCRCNGIANAQNGTDGGELRCSVIVPARNEAGNIEAAVERMPQLGAETEIIFVEGYSKDNTWDEIQRVARKYSDRNIKVLKQKTKGKGGAVREGFAVATGELLMILDADLTMPPEELPKFYQIARSGTAEFINGVRLVYPMEHEAMRFLNMIANKIFGVAFTWLIGQPLKDTLCGTKVLFRSDYERLARNRSYFGDFDPFGDFDLLFGATKLNLQLIDLPIRYRARTYGQTNIQRWQHGWLLLKMVVFAAKRLKFV